MSLSRAQTARLRSAGWTVVEYGPWPALRRLLANRLLGRRWSR